ncbi:hypothetical protein CSPAE12_04569 [Colletotrichum incanum]|nr:hypothetical protein CSPAE12_04569 [Colletotrichum incanum]
MVPGSARREDPFRDPLTGHFRAQGRGSESNRPYLANQDFKGQPVEKAWRLTHLRAGNCPFVPLAFVPLSPQ